MSDLIHFNCQVCGKAYKAQAQHAGRTVSCKECGAKVPIPETTASGSSPKSVGAPAPSIEGPDSVRAESGDEDLGLRDEGESEDRASAGARYTCDICEENFDPTGRSACPFCGEAIPGRAPGRRLSREREEEEEEHKRPGLPWQDKSRGFFDRLFATVKFCCFNPREAGEDTDLRDAWGGAITFNLVIGYIGALFQVLIMVGLGGFLFAAMSSSPLFQGQGAPPPQMLAAQLGGNIFSTLVCGPAMTLVVVFLCGLLVHLGVMIFKAGEGDLQATIVPYMYAYSAVQLITIPVLLLLLLSLLIPVAGVFILIVGVLALSIWSIAVQAQMVAGARGCSTGKGVLAVLTPVFIGFCLVCGLALLFGAFIASVAGGAGGAGFVPGP